MDAAATVRAYYAALDEERYDDLEALLAPGFTQDRPDRTFDDRDAFLTFMRNDRPHADTTHQLHGVFERPGDATTTHDRHVDDGTAIHHVDPTDTPKASTDERETILVRGTLLAPDDTTIVRFVDVFTILADRITALTTYTN
jgi:hypothetical protein